MGARVQPARRRNAAATREAILWSARRAFTRFGYDGVGVREIAEGAGVTAMLVNRYFGSKEQLFGEVVAATMAQPGILTDRVMKPKRDLTTLGLDIAVELMAKTTLGDTPLDGFLIMLRSASNERAAAIWRKLIQRHYQKALTGLLPGGLAPERAALILALISGFQVMRQVIGVPALAQANDAALLNLLARVCQSVIDVKVA
jgi:AcrR family transcriptional regulator